MNREGRLATPVKLYMVSFTKKIRFIVYIKKNNSIIPKSRSFEHRIRTQTQVLQIFKKFNMSQMNPKEVFHNTANSVQLPYIAGHSL